MERSGKGRPAPWSQRLNRLRPVARALAAPVAMTVVAGLIVLSARTPASGTTVMACSGIPAETIRALDELGRLDREQVGNADLINLVGQELGVPPRGRIIAVATALQESSLRNLDHGDLDSLGLFQQRAAWGTDRARMSPKKAARMFYTGGVAGQAGLLDIPSWRILPLTEAAQEVQRSAFPEAYGAWEPLATELVTNANRGMQECSLVELSG